MKHLILGPGSLTFYTMLGYLMKREEVLKEVEEISGSSAGAMLGFLLLSGKSLQEIFDSTINLDTSEMTKVNLKTFINSFGFINHELIKQKLIELWGGNPTFKELPKKLYVSSYCLNDLKTEYFCSDTHPDMHVADAVCASISIPILFSTFDYNGKKYIDGGTIEAIPASPFLNKNFNDVFCLKISDKSYVQNMKMDTILDYFKCIAYTGFNNRITYDVPSVVFDVEHINILDFNAPLEERLKLFMIGFT